MLSVTGRQDIKNKTCSKLNHVIGLQLIGRNTTNSDISGSYSFEYATGVDGIYSTEFHTQYINDWDDSDVQYLSAPP